MDSYDVCRTFCLLCQLEEFPVNSAAVSSRVYVEFWEFVDSNNDKIYLCLDELDDCSVVDEAIPIIHTLHTEDILETVVNHEK